MSQIKDDLKDVVEATMIPEVESYVEDLHKLLEDKTANEDDMEAIKEMESFLVELQNILLAIEEDKISDEQASEVYQNILNLLEESKDH